MPQARRARRPADRRLVGGVAAGIADHLGVQPVAVRLAFVAGAWFNGAGVVAYLLLWRFMPLQQSDHAPGLEAATRRGLRTSTRPGARDVVQGVALVALGVGVLVLLRATGNGIGGALLVPVLVAVIGVAVVWRQLDDASLRRWISGDGGAASSGSTVSAGLRIAAGIALVALAAGYVVSRDRGWGAVIDLGSAALVAVLGVGLVLGPWLYSLLADLADERRARVRSQERADVAAHLHDSVLQTLALLQKDAGDAARVATLARQQERELRSWLYGADATIGERFAASLRGIAAEVEDAHQVPIEVVVVGDVDLDPDAGALVRAAREAMVNASRHSGADRVDVYAETDGRTARVFVRDRGVGFDLGSVGSDRMGVRGSIIGRVERHHGSAQVRSEIGGGTEVALEVPLRGRATTIEEVST